MSAITSYQSMLQRLNALVSGTSARALTPALNRPITSLPAWLQPKTPTPAATPPAPSPLGRDTFVRTSGFVATPPLPAVTPSPALTPASTLTRRPPSDPNAYFMTQFYHPRWNPQGPDGSTNCGPASLAMAMKAFGLTPPGVTDLSNVEAFIDKTRRAMMGTENDLQLSSDDDVLRGALTAGAKAEKVHGIQAVEQAIAQGKLVVLAGNPAAYGHRFDDSQLQYFDGGHFITVTHMVGDRVWINDPLSKVGSLEITRAELERYMGYQNWNVGVAVWA